MKKKIVGFTAVILAVFILFIYASSFIWFDYASEAVDAFNQRNGQTGLTAVWFHIIVLLFVMANVLGWPKPAKAREYNWVSCLAVWAFPALTLLALTGPVEFLQHKGHMAADEILRSVVTPAYWIAVALAVGLAVLFDVLLIQISKNRKKEDNE